MTKYSLPSHDVITKFDCTYLFIPNLACTKWPKLQCFVHYRPILTSMFQPFNCIPAALLTTCWGRKRHRDGPFFINPPANYAFNYFITKIKKGLIYAITYIIVSLGCSKMCNKGSTVLTSNLTLHRANFVHKNFGN